jgi:eukaryotic-like serine/threonine-protein kinase
MHPQKNCPYCSSETARNSKEGFCTRCLFASAVEFEAEETEGRNGDFYWDGALLEKYGNYEIIEEIGRGGMGVVYRAFQSRVRRMVALKLIKGGALATPEQLARFESEVETASNLDHPNIVPIYELGEQDGHYYFSMRLVEGCSLQKHLGMRSKVTFKLVHLLVHAARAVEYAHGRGVLHLDIKPGNIMLDFELQPHLIDFGMGRISKGAARKSSARHVCGTPGYMAPEQAVGEDSLLTPATDVYGLGAVLYEIITGQVVFGALSRSEALLQLKTRKPRRPSQLNPEVDRQLEMICLKSLENKPEMRYQSAQAFADELERWCLKSEIQSSMDS